MNLPNLITLARVISVPIIFWFLLTSHYQLAFITFLAAGLSDAIDGYLAKRFNWETELGAYLDPLADKLLIVCIYLALGVLNELPSWLVIGVVSRDVLIVSAVVLSWLLDHPIKVSPFIVSKANTLAQIILASVVLADLGYNLGLQDLRTLLVWITAALTLASLLAYLRAWMAHMSGA